VWGERYGNDNHYYLIEYLKAIQGGWLPPENVSKEEYNHIKQNKDEYPPSLVGGVGFGCSFGGKWWGGYARDFRGDRDFATETRSNAKKQAPLLTGITFTHGDYKTMFIPDNSFIYCDPPYEGTTKYKAGAFDHVEFWEWCRQKVREGHKVFVSEYNAPDDFTLEYEREQTTHMNNNSSKKKRPTEKLFSYRL
jgi:DNA adenine methylase